MVSVVMAAYNAEHTIKAAIDSVIAQTYADWELIITDDRSGDATQEIIQAAAKNEPRIRLFIHEKNEGASATRNTGVKNARGEWIAFLDSDDMWRTDKLERQLAFAAETGADITYTATSYITETGAASAYVLRAQREFTYKELLRKNVMSCSSVMVKTEFMQNAAFAGDKLHEDYAAWLTILRVTGRAYGLDEPLLIYRVSAGSKSGNRLRSAGMVYNTYRHVNYGRLRSAAMTVRYAAHSVTKRAMIRMRVSNTQSVE